MAFITATEFLNQRDKRRVADFCSDTGVPIPASSLTTNTILLQMLEEGAGVIVMACRLGERYSLEDLHTLAASTDYSGSALKRLNGDLSYCYLMARRGLSEEETAQLSALKGEAMATIDQLRLGERIFDIGGAPDAGLPEKVVLGIDSQIDGTAIATKTRLWGRTSFTNPWGWRR